MPVAVKFSLIYIIYYISYGIIYSRLYIILAENCMYLRLTDCEGQYVVSVSLEDVALIVHNIINLVLQRLQKLIYVHLLGFMNIYVVY